jgi:hypothetical protein
MDKGALFDFRWFNPNVSAIPGFKEAVSRCDIAVSLRRFL